MGVALLIGVWINSLAYIPAAHLGAINRPDLPAKFHAYEIIPFLGVLWFGLHYFGLLGAAWAWTVRVAVDALLLFVVAKQTAKPSRVLPGLFLVILASLFRPAAFFSLSMLAEIVLLFVSIFWSWKVSSFLQSTVRSLPRRLGRHQIA